MSRSRFAKYAWLVLLYTLAVIAWGAFVRASFSGDGCGSNWPLCGGQIIPKEGSPLKTFIEASHRITSELLGFLVLGLVVWAFRAFPKGHQVRKISIVAGVFSVTEALLGMWLVKKGYVTHDDSVGRVGAMALHLTNTLIMVGAMATISLVADAKDQAGATIKLKGQGPLLGAIVFSLVCDIVLGISGAITALGHQLKPTDDVLRAAASPTAHFLSRLQPLHAFIATSIGLVVLLTGGLLIHLRPSEQVKHAARWMIGAYAVQFILGLINIQLNAPIWFQMVHLVSADVCWIALIAAGVAALRTDAPRLDVDREVEPGAQAQRPHGRALIKEYVALTKPRVISLLLFTTIAAMFAAANGFPGWTLLIGLLVGGYMSAGAANAINMVIDRDIDASMARTSKRPTVTENIPSHHALFFGFAMAALSFAIISLTSNLLAAMLSLAGLVFYVIVYTLLLKRRTWQNIVIGGAAGCFPPLVGWAAVTDQLSPFAIVLFAIIFMWTPVHFWALALLIKDDYAAAGIPMLPVVRGDRVTVVQIIFYGILTAIVSALPLFQREASWLYMATIILLNSVLMLRCLGLYRNVDRPHAASLYKFSLAYLFLLFLMVAVDRAVLARPEPTVGRPRVVSVLPWEERRREFVDSEGITRMVEGYGSAI